jgi:hypothetical protein
MIIYSAISDNQRIRGTLKSRLAHRHVQSKRGKVVGHRLHCHTLHLVQYLRMTVAVVTLREPLRVAASAASR